MATGSWSFELQVTDAISVMVTSNAVSVIVNAVPTVAMSPTSWTMDIGQSKIFSAFLVVVQVVIQVIIGMWVGLLSLVQTASTFSYSPTSLGSYSITVTVTDSLGSTSAQSSAASVAVKCLFTDCFCFCGPVNGWSDFSLTSTLFNWY